MLATMLAMLFAAEGGTVWFFGRRLAAHAKSNPQATVAWWDHVIKPAFTPVVSVAPADDPPPKS